LATNIFKGIFLKIKYHLQSLSVDSSRQIIFIGQIAIILLLWFTLYASFMIMNMGITQNNRCRVALASAFLAFAIFSCKGKPELSDRSMYEPRSGATIVADTITYNVQIGVTDTSDLWSIECLKHMNQPVFIDYIFNGIYKGSLVAHDFNNGMVIPAQKVRQIELQPGFSRGKITKIQFKELWYIDSLGFFRKEIISYTLGLESYSNQNTFLGYSPVFVVKPRAVHP
jgi:hypothetical protein